MSSSSSQKFIARNRAPRVQIEYDVEIYGSEKRIELPFVMGVLADLSGKPVEPLPGVDERKFLEIDIDNFDERMKAIAPRVAFSVPNTLKLKEAPDASWMRALIPSNRAEVSIQLQPHGIVLAEKP